jgi:S-adenosylmethionine synthetase
VIARDIPKAVENIRKEKYMDVLMPDGKCRATVRYEDSKPKDIKTIVVSAQTKKGVKLEEIKRIIKEEVLILLLGSTLDGIEILVNPTGAFYRGGPYADSGLTGRKLMVDTYGRVAHHGRGALSGKDYTKVDRSGAYYARFVAKSIVKAGLADKCEVAVSYSIGVAKPISVSIDTFGTGKISDDEILKLINDHFDFCSAPQKLDLF